MITDAQIENTLANVIADFDPNAEVTKELLVLRRERIVELEKAMTKIPGAQNMHEFNEGKITHHFGTGVYGRELFIPAGSVIVSKIHRAKTFNIIAKGVISVICPNRGFNTYHGPHTFVSEPFTKRVVIAHEDTLWITAHGYTSDNQDIEAVEDYVIAKDFEDMKFLNDVKGDT